MVVHPSSSDGDDVEEVMSGAGETLTTPHPGAPAAALVIKSFLGTITCALLWFA